MLLSRGFENSRTTVLPVFLILDISSSMHGSKMEAVNTAVWGMMEHFTNEMHSGVDIIFSAISFGDKARLHMPLSYVYDLKWKPMIANGVTALGAALKMVKKMIEDKQTTPLKSFRPLIVLVTDGSPTDSWEQSMEDFIRNGRSSKCDRMALAIGMSADNNVLNLFLEGTNHSLVRAKNVAQVYEFFQKVSKSISIRASSSNPNLVPDDSLVNITDQNDFDNENSYSVNE